MCCYGSSQMIINCLKKEIIEDSVNTVYVSIASLWEIVIKVNIGKLELDMDFEKFFRTITDDYDFNVLQIHERHLCRYLELPLYHRDPFDRLIYILRRKVKKWLFCIRTRVFKYMRRLNILIDPICFLLIRASNFSRLPSHTGAGAHKKCCLFPDSFRPGCCHDGLQECFLRWPAPGRCHG